jgi:hypothetical protein
VPESGYIFSAGKFGDVQLHVEWATPVPASGRGQGRGNSGIFLMGLFEVQVLDSHENETYADGQAGAIYGQHPPRANACLPPGEWQSYDIVFRRPHFHEDGSVARPARITVLHNGILVQDNVTIWGPTTWLQHRAYERQPDKLPISLQDHGNPVRFRQKGDPKGGKGGFGEQLSASGEEVAGGNRIDAKRQARSGQTAGIGANVLQPSNDPAAGYARQPVLASRVLSTAHHHGGDQSQIRRRQDQSDHGHG